MTTLLVTDTDRRKGKGNKKTRAAPHIRPTTAGPYEVEKRIQTPNSIAIGKLTRLLERPGFKYENKRPYLELLREAPQLRFMNMHVLAEVILYMYSVNGVVNGSNFSYQILTDNGYIDKLIPHKESSTKPKDETEDTLKRIRMAATFLRYIRYIYLLRDREEQTLQEAIKDQEAMIPLRIDEQ